MRFKFISHLFLLLLFSSNVTNGQVLGPELKTGKFEIGYFWKNIHRKLKPDFLSGNNWYVESIFMKYGVSNWITLSAEGAVWPIKDDRYPERNYRSYKVGAGIISRVFEIKKFRIALAFHYNEIFYFDRSPYESVDTSTYHKNTRGIISTIQIERIFSFRGQNVTLWISPAYVYDEVLQYSSLNFKTYTDKSFNNFGFVVGANLMLFKHIEPFFHIVYADFFQPRGGIGYLF
ncbi:MAG: hypothetical protein OEZ20_04760 [candidate division WOR-3 bacterium]|nr:hypothetical protein [candidate division WOR-3 bacterium]